MSGLPTSPGRPQHASPANERPRRDRRADKAARGVQYGSAVVFSVFMSWHLAATISAVSGGEQSASQTMLLWYQRADFPSEPIVVFGAAIAHFGAGVVRRLLKPDKSRKHVSAHAKAGYLLVPVVAAHSYVHRIRPARAGVSPASLSYAFVVHSLHRSPIFSWAAYGLIAVVGSWHAIAGMRRIVSRDRKPAKLQTTSWRAGFAAAIAGLGVGLARLHAEAPIPSWLAKRYDPLL